VLSGFNICFRQLYGFSFDEMTALWFWYLRLSRDSHTDMTRLAAGLRLPAKYWPLAACKPTRLELFGWPEMVAKIFGWPSSDVGVVDYFCETATSLRLILGSRFLSRNLPSPIFWHGN